MKVTRFTDLEKKYAAEAIENEFNTSKNSEFNNRLESSICKLFNIGFAIGHVNGTATLHTALASLGIGTGDEVIVPPLTMSSTSLAVLQNGSIPVFADVDPETFNLDADSVENCIGPRTRAVMTVALYGLSPDYDRILEVCRRHKLFLIEDNAQCFKSTYREKLVGTFGDFASFSFQASKHLTSGEGGMLITNDPVLADKARRFSSLGYAGVSGKQGKISRNDIQDPQYDRHVSLGFNYRMSEVNAAVLVGQVERADELVGQRIRAAEILLGAVAGTGLFRPQRVPDHCKNTYWTVALAMDTLNPQEDWYRFRDLFQSNGGDGYYAAWKLSYDEPLFLRKVSRLPGIRQEYSQGLCPNAEYLQPRMLQLKTNYWDLEEAKKQAGILEKTIKQFVKFK